jgi:hypothetical protein
VSRLFTIKSSLQPGPGCLGGLAFCALIRASTPRPAIALIYRGSCLWHALPRDGFSSTLTMRTTPWSFGSSLRVARSIFRIHGMNNMGSYVMKRTVGSVALGLSACGYPLTQFAIRRWGVRGAAVAEAVCAGLAIRDAWLIDSGVPVGLRKVPAALLDLELAAAITASVAGLAPLLANRSVGQPLSARVGAVEAVRRAAVAALFTVHTIRFGIYLRPGHGRREWAE